MSWIAIGQFMQESHSFTPVDSSWDQLHAGHIYRGEEILKRMTGNQVEMAGAHRGRGQAGGGHGTVIGLQRGVGRILGSIQFHLKTLLASPSARRRDR